jgi:hypothetical protein
LGIDFKGGASSTGKPFAIPHFTAACVSIIVSALEASTINILRIISVDETLWALVGIAPLLCSTTLCVVGVGAILVVTEQALIMLMEGARRALK